MWNYPWSNYALLSCWNRIPIEERISSRRLKFKPIQSLLHWPTTTVNDREWRTTITTGPLLLRIDSGRSSLNIQFYQHRIRNIPSGGSLRYLGSESCLFVIIVWWLPKGKPIRSAVYPIPVYSSSQTAEGMEFQWKDPRRGWRSSAIVDEHLCYSPENVLLLLFWFGSSTSAVVALGHPGIVRYFILSKEVGKLEML